MSEILLLMKRIEVLTLSAGEFATLTTFVSSALAIKYAAREDGMNLDAEMDRLIEKAMGRWERK